MMRVFQILIIVLVTMQCQTKQTNFDGHYLSTDKYDQKPFVTLDIVDSFAILNNKLIFRNQRDTFFIDKESRVLRKIMTPDTSFYFKVSNDTVFLCFTRDCGEEVIKFVQEDYLVEDYFSLSNIEIDLLPLNNEEQIDLNGYKLKYLTIGSMKKGILWGIADSTYIELDNEILLQMAELGKLGGWLKNDTLNWAVCVNFDRHISKSNLDLIRNQLIENIDKKRLFETRLKDNIIVFVK